MEKQKWRKFDMEELETTAEKGRQWTQELLEQNRKIIEQNEQIVKHNVMMLEKLSQPGGIIIKGSIDEASDT